MTRLKVVFPFLILLAGERRVTDKNVWLSVHDGVLLRMF